MQLINKESKHWFVLYLVILHLLPRSLIANNSFSDLNSSFGSPTKRSGPGTSQSVIPVCIRQLLGAEEEFTLFGTKSHIVTLVCIVRDFVVQTAKISFSLEDHTGNITGNKWIDSENQQTPTYELGTYVKVFGSYKNVAKQKSVLIMHIEPIRDPNVITTHLLEMMHARFAIEKISKQEQQEPAGPSTSHAGLLDSPDRSLYFAQQTTPVKLQEQINIDNVDFDNIDSSGDTHGFTPMQFMVVHILRMDKSVNGMTKEEILIKFSPPQRKEANEAFEYLQHEGHIYSTVDDYHFKNTL